MTRWRRWPSYQAWRVLRHDTRAVIKVCLPYFEQPKIKLTLTDSRTDEERERADAMEIRLITAREFFYGVIPIRREGEWQPEWLKP